MDCLTYRGDILLWSLGLIVQPVVLLLVWIAVINSGGKTPLSREQFVQYYVLLMIVKIWVQAWASQFIANDIRLGRISPFILKPVPYLFHQLGNNLGNKFLKLIFMTVVIAILILAFGFRPPELTLFTLILFLVSWFIAGVSYFVLDVIIGLAAFWLDDTIVLDDFVDTLLTIFSGQVVPLLAYPLLVRQISAVLPFRYMISFPIEILLGRLSNFELFFGLGAQLAWTAVFFGLYQVLWQRGLKKYSAVGA